MPFKARFQMTVFGSLVLKLYITLVFIREGDLAKLIAEAARARKPVSGRLQKLLRSDFVRYIRNSLAHGTFENAIVGIRFSGGEKIVTATPGFLDHLATCLSVAQLQAAAAGLRRVNDR
jgi:predicted ATP-dependent Lon-type protease